MNTKETTKRKWLEALRSGDYEQGTDYLERVSDGVHQYCCLGVLCDVVGLEKTIYDHQENYVYIDPEGQGPNGHWEQFVDDGWFHDFLGFSKQSFSNVSGSLDTLDMLINMNDVKHYDFNRIANWIEDNL